MSVMMSVTEPARRFEVFTGAGQRRRWTAAEKAQIVEESFGGEESVCAVARRHGLASTQLFAWRKEARDRAAETSFVPLLVEAAGPPVIAERKERRRRSRDGGIELEIDGVVVRVSRGAEVKTVAAVIQALKAGR